MKILKFPAIGAVVMMGMVLVAAGVLVWYLRTPSGQGLHDGLMAYWYATFEQPKYLPGNETQWIASRTSETIQHRSNLIRVRRGMSARLGAPGLVMKRDSAAPEGWRVMLQTSSGQIELPMDRHIWDPEGYVGLARDMIKGVSPVDAGTAAAAEVDGLLQGGTVPLAQAERRCSARLAERPDDPEAHAQAALILGLFALREPEHTFHDTRWALCQMTAHLAMAQALRGEEPAGMIEQLALIFLHGHAGATAEAMRRLRRGARRCGYGSPWTGRLTPGKRRIRGWCGCCGFGR